MPRRVSAPAALALLLWLGAVGAAPSGDLRIEPVSLSLRPDQPSATLWISNRGPTTLEAQLRVFSWTQENGAEVLVPTRDLAASPPLVQVPPQGRQLVRLVRTGGAGVDTPEAAYRLIVDQLPGNVGQAAAKTPLLRYSIPVFTGPTLAGAGHRHSARIESDPAGHRLLRLDNSGDRHARVAALAFIGTGGRRQVLAPSLAGYVLAGRYKLWPLPDDIGSPPYGRFEADVNGEPAVLVPEPALFGGR